MHIYACVYGFMYVCIYVYIKCMDVLLKEGSYVNLSDDQEWIPLHAAVLGRSLKAVKVLLKNNALANHLNSEGLSPLHMAVYINNPIIAQELLNAGADPIINNEEKSPLQLAIELKNTDLLDCILGADSLLVSQ